MLDCWVEGRVVVADGTSWDKVLAGSGDYFIEVFGRKVDVVVVGDVVVLELFFYCCREFVPVCFFVVGVSDFGSADVGRG